MGLLDFFRKSGSPVEKYASKVVTKLSQAPERMAAVRSLAALKSEDAVAAMLPRFTFHIDPNNWDQQEKEETFNLLVEMGPLVVAPTIRFIEKNTAVSWALKVLFAVAPDQAVGALLELLEKMDTEYERNPERKVQILQSLEGQADPRLASAVLRFLQDINENARLHTAGALVGQNLETIAGDLVMAAANENSSRVRARICDALASHPLSLQTLCTTDTQKSALKTLRSKLPTGYTIDAAGLMRAPH